MIEVMIRAQIVVVAAMYVHAIEIIETAEISTPISLKALSFSITINKYYKYFK